MARTTMEAKMRLSLVVFDVAGTTVVDDDNVAYALEDALHDVGIKTAPEDVVRVMGLAKPVAIEALCRGKVDPEALSGLVSRAHSAFVERMIHHYLTSRGVRPIEGTETTFQALREEGIAIALDTGFSRPILDAILVRLGWYEDVVDATVSSDEVAAGRPQPLMIQRAMSLLGVASPASVMKVGDTVADIQEGLAAGARAVVGVLSGTCSRAELDAAGATHIVADVSVVPRLIFGTPRYAAPRLLRDRLFSA